VLALFGKPLISLFTGDPDMIQLVSILLFVDIALEIGRSLNLIYGFALKTSGDAVFPMVIAVVFVFLCAAGGTWLFGIRLGWLAVGAYIGMAMDECIRAVLMATRWHNGNWKKHRIITDT
jgi:Na+-driven multidrug efflux pump